MRDYGHLHTQFWKQPDMLALIGWLVKRDENLKAPGGGENTAPAGTTSTNRECRS